ncbi:MAG: hypothetical protein H6718_30175 [Polyangiaceae bacterium]|nr:hypothetical protein [Myxococcales bacterium]MCB9589720.1 hypothetical protein [Polyangiaceae bacterium]
MSNVEWLRHQVDEAERHARAVAGGLNIDEWNSLRQSYGLGTSLETATPISLRELDEVLEALRRYAEARLASFSAQEQHGAEAGSLRARLQQLTQATAPPASPVSGLLGGIFANAAANKNWESNEQASCQVTLRCPHCGAYQERALDFCCAYCRKAIAGGGQ